MDALNLQQQLIAHQNALRACRQCPNMIGPVVTGLPVLSPVMLIGQAPGAKEGPAGKPFAWTAGKTLFRWFSGIGLDEAAFRPRIYMAAVCRCFPGKHPQHGDRLPNPEEVARCGAWLDDEVRLLQPRLIIPVGKLAISLFLPPAKLSDQVGQQFSVQRRDLSLDVIPLPHPSGASPWHRTQPGIDLLQQALVRIAAHPAWQAACALPLPLPN